MENRRKAAMKKKPSKPKDILKVLGQRAHTAPRISTLEIAKLTGCESLEVKRWVYRLYPEAFNDTEEGKPIYLTWDEAREVLIKLCQDPITSPNQERILMLDALLLREGRSAETDRREAIAECRVNGGDLFLREAFDQRFPNCGTKAVGRCVLYIDQEWLMKPMAHCVIARSSI
jgi:hypothetical protein